MQDKVTPREGIAIVKGHAPGSGWRYDLVGETPKIFYEEIYRRERSGGLGDVLHGTGRFIKTRLGVMSPGSRREIDATAAAVKSAVRRLREREAVEIAAIDAEIEELRSRHIEATARRKAALARGFANGHVITLAEAKAIADANLAAREARKADRDA